MTEDKKALPLAEIVTGFIIVTILFAFGLPRFLNWNQGSAIGDETSKLYDNLQTAKNTAAKTNHRVWIVFQGTEGYTIFEDANQNGNADPGEPIRKIKLNPEIQFGVNLEPPIQNVWGTGTLSQPIDFVGGENKVYFESNGKASKSGAVYLIAKTDIGLSGADFRAVRIIGANGDISILKFSPSDSPPWK